VWFMGVRIGDEGGRVVREGGDTAGGVCFGVEDGWVRGGQDLSLLV
jgi:hypothetical protein